MLDKSTMKLFNLQDKISDLLQEAYEEGLDPDVIASMVVATGDGFGLLFGRTWEEDRITIYRNQLELADEAEDEENNLLF